MISYQSQHLLTEYNISYDQRVREDGDLSEQIHESDTGVFRSGILCISGRQPMVEAV